MKGIFFRRMTSFIAMTLVCTAAFAQNTQDVYSSVVPNLSHITVRTSSNGDAVISGRCYSEIVGNDVVVKSEFIKFDQNISASRQIIIDKFGINDFCVMDGCVYFCGEDGNASYFGYFNESAFNNTSPFYATTFKLPVDFASKIIVYKDDATNNVVVAIVGGKYKDVTVSYAVKNSHLIVGQINGSAFSCYNYDVNVNNPHYFNFDITFQEVALTDDYIVAVGMETLSSHKITLSRIKKTNLNTREYVSFADPAYSAVESPVILESLEGNDVAFSSLYIDMTNSLFYSRVYTCDMNSFTNQSIQDVLLPQKTMPDDLRYLPYDQSLLLLLTAGDFPSHGHSSSIVYYLDPYTNSSYTADFLYDEDLRWHSLDRMPGSHFVIGGKKTNDTRFYVIRDKQAGTISQCHNFSTTNVTIEPVLTGLQGSEKKKEDIIFENNIKCTPSDIILYQGCSD